MPHYTHHIFVCENFRDESDPRGCCGAKGSKEIRAALKSEIKSRGLKASLPYIEIYGHWDNDESRLETEMLISIK